jgi:hypothetical protein
VCPEGFIKDMGKQGSCVREEECTCRYNDKYFNTEEKVAIECNEW